MASRIEIINQSDKLLGKGIKSTQIAILEQIISRILKFDTSQGSFEFTDRNIRLINELEKEIRSIVLNSKYETNVQEYLRNFEKIKEANIIEAKAVNGVNAGKIGLSKIQKQVQDQTVSNLLGQGMDTNFVTPVKESITNSVVSGASIEDATQTLRTFVRGDKTRLGTLDRYVSQVARDSISQYDGMIQSRIADKFGMNAWSYEGSLIKDSRPQCVRWAGSVIKKTDLEQELNWAYNNGTGMIPGTTPDNFGIYRGGYNCRHFATAVFE